MHEKYTRRFDNFAGSLEALKLAKDRDPEDTFVLSGTAQKFNITFDLSWKIMKELLVGYYKVIDFAQGSPREVIRKAGSVGLVEDDIWMDMLNDRNNLAHDYDGTMVRGLFDIIVGQYTAAFEKFRTTVENMDFAD